MQADSVAILSIDATICKEICDGLDNDFDGIVGEGLVPEPCPIQQGVCAGTVKICDVVAGWLPCDASTYGNSYEPSETLWDSLDNDCNGAVEGMSRSWGFNDEGLCQLGIETCIDGTWVSCEGAVYPTDEICGDNVDNDCDWMVDEDCPSS